MLLNISKRNSLIFILILIPLVISYFLFSSKVIPESDDATNILIAQDFIKGNLLLKGWYLPSDNHYTTETPYYVIYMFLRGLNSSDMSVVPIIIFIVNLILCSYLAGYNLPNKLKKHSYLFCLLIVGTPSIYFLNIVSRGGVHIATLNLILISIISLLVFLSTNKLLFYIFFILFLLAAQLGDPFTIPLLILPLVTIFGYRLIKDYKQTHYIDKNSFLIFIISLLSPLIGLCSTTFLNVYLGGFSTAQIQNSLIPIKQITSNFTLLISQFPKLLGIAYTNSINTSLNTISSSVHLLLAIIMIIFIAFIIKNRLFKLDLLSYFLILGMGYTLIFYMENALTDVFSAARYLIPLVIYFAIFSSRLIPTLVVNNSKNLKLLYIGLSIIAVIYFINIYQVIKIPTPTQTYYSAPPQNIITILKKNNLHNGYGSYWDASIITVLTNNSIKVRPIIFQYSAAIRDNLLSNSNWYSSPSNFYIFDNQSETSINHRPYITVAGVIAAFGQPVKQYNIGTYHILIWNHDISNDVFRIIPLFRILPTSNKNTN